MNKCLLLKLLFIVYWSFATCFSEEAKVSRPWTCFYQSPKIDDQETIASAKNLSYYANLIPEFDAEFKMEARNGGKVKSEIREVGWIHGKKVVDVFYHLIESNLEKIPGEKHKKHEKPENEKLKTSVEEANIKTILVEWQKDSWRPLLFRSRGTIRPFHEELNSSKILKVKDQYFIVSRDRIEGTGNLYIEYFFLYDPKNEKIVRMNFNQKILEILSRILPQGYSVWKGGKFNIETLSFESSVWKEGDSNCCPTGGRASIKFMIEKSEIKEVSSQYFQ